MKTIYIVFNDREKVDTCTNLFEDLRFVFEDYVSVKLCFLCEIEPGDISDGDLFLVLYKDRVYPMKNYISSLDKVMVMSRTFERQYLDDVYNLPSGTDVLVVNDSNESTIQSTNSLYELGLNHLNLVPYISADDDGRYDHIKVAITPGEPDNVPSYVEKIIDVQNRCIDANTFVTIINKLNLNHNQINRNLLAYIERTTGSTGEKYIADSIKDQLLRQTIQQSRDAIIITDSRYIPIHFNENADFVFNLSKNATLSLDLLFNEIADDLFSKDDYVNKLIRFQNVNYIVTKTSVRVLDQYLGCSLRFSTETDIKNLEIDLNKQLMKKGLIAKYRFTDILYQSEEMEKSIALAKKVALTNYTILISGESGTGKELFAQSIHNFSDRKDQPFVAINCAALPETLLESELFGYEKGAFTGASRQGKVGLFEQANHGTIFLDEIGDMSLSLQSRLLRVLQEKQITRIGSDKVIDLDIRVLAATNRDLSEAVEKKEFRNDLYYRLCNIPIQIPPLRQRREDITYIFSHLTRGYFSNLSEAQISALRLYHWPGNVRELKNAADYYMTLGELPATITCCSNQERSVPVAPKIPQKPSGEELLELILAIIRQHTEEASGIGRVAIQNELRAYGIQLSDDKLRKILHQLQGSGKISIGRGRTGCMIL